MSLMRLGLSLGLAGAAGVRTYLPLIIVGLLTRFSETLSYRPPFRIFASAPILLLLTALAGYELFFWRLGNTGGQVALMTGFRAFGGAIVFAGLSTGLGIVPGLIIGAGVAVVSHMLTIRFKAFYLRDSTIPQDKPGAGLEETLAVAVTVLALVIPWSTYLIWGGIVFALLRKIRRVNSRYRNDAKARPWR